MKKISLFLAICMLFSIAAASVSADETAENLALKGTATACQSYSSAPASKAIDGDLNTVWNANLANTETSPWITVELNKVSDISSIVIHSYYNSSNTNFSILQYSIDGETWHDFSYTLSTEKEELYNGGTLSPYGHKRTYTLPNTVRAAYVKVGNAVQNCNLTICELEIYGTEVDLPGAKNIAPNGTATASVTYGSAPASNAIDGDIGTLWNSNTTSPDTPWIIVELEKISEINSIVVYENHSVLDNRFLLQYSVDGESWTDLADEADTTEAMSWYNSTGKQDTNGWKKTYTFETVSAKYVKIYNEAAGDKLKISEIEIYEALDAEAALTGLFAEDYELTPEFSPEITSYTCTIGSGAALPEVTAEADDTVWPEVTQPTEENMRGIVNAISMVDTSVKTVYEITFVRASGEPQISAAAPVLYHSDEENGEETVVDVPSAGFMSAEVSVSQNGGEDTELMVITAAYDESGRLTGVSVKNQEITYKGTLKIKSDAIQLNDGESFRCFVWDKATLKPYLVQIEEEVQ